MNQPEIDMDRRAHSHLYELKPMSRWWFVFGLALATVGAWVNGFDQPTTWFLLMCGALVAAFAVLCFPRLTLTKRD